MVRSSRFCRRIINHYVGRILTVIRWGVKNELVEPRTEQRLRAVQSLSKGTPGTFDHKKHRDVPDEDKIISLGLPEQTLIAPYLIGKKTAAGIETVRN